LLDSVGVCSLIGINFIVLPLDHVVVEQAT
jgi:hypothetical protein